MKQFPQGIFQSIEWLIKQVEKLKYQISQVGSSISVDGTTIQGAGTVADPLKSYSSFECITYSGAAIDLTSSTNNLFLIINDTGIAGNDLTFPPVVAGKKITIVNQTGFTFDILAPIPVDVDGTPTSGIATGALMEVIGVTNSITSTSFWLITNFRTV